MSQALAVEEPPSRVIRTWLLNPFHYVAGGKALAVGLAAIVASGLLCIVTASHFDGVIDFHTGRKVVWWLHLIEGPIDWLAMSVLLLIAGFLVSGSRFRALDVFGTQALARLPGLAMVLVSLLPPVRRVNERIAEAVMGGQIPGLFDASDPAGSTFFVFALLAIVIMSIWMIMWMYRAFSVSCNASGPKAVGAFIVVVIVGEILTKVLFVSLIAHASP